MTEEKPSKPELAQLTHDPQYEIEIKKIRI